MLAPRGTACLVGSARAGTEVSLEMRVLQQGRHVRGCVQGESAVQSFLPALIEHYRRGELPVDRLVRHYAHGAINEAVDDLLTGTTVKPVLLMEPAPKASASGRPLAIATPAAQRLAPTWPLPPARIGAARKRCRRIEGAERGVARAAVH